MDCRPNGRIARMAGRFTVRIATAADRCRHIVDKHYGTRTGDSLQKLHRDGSAFSSPDECDRAAARQVRVSLASGQVPSDSLAVDWLSSTGIEFRKSFITSDLFLYLSCFGSRRSRVQIAPPRFS